ncbi:MAG: YfhO family protein [Verrucomicrobia bacterium]|jgi:hypothetical protein|nr:YfhO family protein [Verrucomicrobiota bacterium]MBT7067569.1 YfhO family protein [Verrucomicrobiota bacterium]MBT7700137.1 YfhO family protein [Verrucomicrobiota bacterium]
MQSERKKSWILDLSLLAFLCLALLAPALFFGTPTFVNDALHDEIPQLQQLARGLRAGGPPLSNPDVFAGARPSIYDPIWLYYVPCWPFLMMADGGDPASFARSAVLLPYLLHMLLAAAGTYVFLRHTLAAGRLGALVGGVLYAFSPAFSTAIENINHVALMAWLPWLAVAGTAFLRRGGALRWAAALLVLVAANSSGVMHLLVRMYAFTSLLFFLVWLGLGAEGGAWPARIGRLAGLASAYVLAAGILGPMWAGIYEAWPLVQSAVSELTTASSTLVQRYAAEGHTPVLHFASLFCPDLFGVVSLHGWGVAIDQPVTQLGHVGGGVAMMSVILYGLIRLLRGGSDADRVAKAWWRAAAGVCLFLIILMMGKHTFLYAPLARLGGFLVSGPHPHYYQFGACWLLAVLAGLGVAELSAIDQRRQRKLFAGLAVGCGLAVVTAVMVSLCSPINTEALSSKTAALMQDLSAEHPRLLWVHAMRSTGGIRWLLVGPGIYVLLSVIGCAAAARFCPARRLASLALIVLLVLLVEYGVFAGTLIYATTSVSQHELDFSPGGNRRPKFAHLGELNAFNFAAELSDLAEEGNCRWAMAWSRGDNMAQCFGSRALLGYASRPLIKGFYEAARQVYQGFPYRLGIQRGKDKELRQFLENENVGFMLAASGQRVIRFDPIPAVYRQTVVHEMDETNQLAATLSRSFSDACLVLPGTRLRWIQPVEHPPAEAQAPAPLTWSRPHADRIELRSRGATAAMTVITECWHSGWQATVDDDPAPVHKVNHHQMAVELPAGDHEVTLRFRPRCITVGCWISAASLVAALAMCGGLAFVKRREER